MEIDVTKVIGAVERTVRHGAEREGVPVYAVTARRSYPTGVEDLWDAVTNEERLPRWFLPVTGDLREGGRYHLEGNAGGSILVCEAPTQLSLTWEFGGGVSWLEIRLHSEGPSTTRLELEHLVPDDDHWRTYGPGAAGVGWDLGLMGLDRHLAEGGAEGSEVDPAEAIAWMGSPEGLDFIRRSSAGWGGAAAAAGVPEEEAAAMQDRTTAIYTGGQG